MKPKPPCHGCPDRTSDCHSGDTCAKWAAYRALCTTLAAAKERDGRSNHDARTVRRSRGKKKEISPCLKT